MCEVLNKYVESDKESNKELNKESNKESHKESSDAELIETISPKNDENTTNWYDKNKFDKILTTIDSNNFNHKNKISKFNASLMTLMTWSIILKIIQLVKQILKRK